MIKARVESGARMAGNTTAFVFNVADTSATRQPAKKPQIQRTRRENEKAGGQSTIKKIAEATTRTTNATFFRAGASNTTPANNA